MMLFKLSTVIAVALSATTAATAAAIEARQTPPLASCTLTVTPNKAPSPGADLIPEWDWSTSRLALLQHTS